MNPFDITHRFTHLFWLGDLNYRIELPSTDAENIVSKIKQQQYQDLLGKDQLNMERDEGKVFLHFTEEDISFAPTYRFERDTREKYAYTKAKATGDAAQVHGGNPSLPGLKKLTLGFCWNLNSEISRILPTLEAFQRVLDQQISPGIGRSRSQVKSESMGICTKMFLKKREGFCQLLQQLKNKHSAKPDPDMITVFVGTWNMGNAGPPHNIRSWFQCQGQGRTRDDTADHIPHDLYVIGTQEDPLGEREWSETGAVGVSFMFNRTSFGRNQNYLYILRFLNLGDKKMNPFDITHRFTHLFWLGDLNYRIELPSTDAENIVSKIKQQQYQDLLGKDQLNMERDEGKVFLHFTEEDISFAPTYRFERDTREKYAYTKAKATGTKYNLPSWCDRVLSKSYPLVHVVCQS
ncbi:hypothetical protein CRUP_031863, partial [Coryphaenoides rupestris]